MLNVLWMLLLIQDRYNQNHEQHACTCGAVGGNKAGFLAHQDLYSMLGSYIPWPMVMNRGATIGTHGAGCLVFDYVLIAQSEFAW